MLFLCNNQTDYDNLPDTYIYTRTESTLIFYVNEDLAWPMLPAFTVPTSFPRVATFGDSESRNSFMLTAFVFYSRPLGFLYTYRKVIICYLIVYYLIFVHLLFNVWQKKSPLYYYNGVLYLLVFHQSES